MLPILRPSHFTVYVLRWKSGIEHGYMPIHVDIYNYNMIDISNSLKDIAHSFICYVNFFFRKIALKLKKTINIETYNNYKMIKYNSERKKIQEKLTEVTESEWDEKALILIKIREILIQDKFLFIKVFLFLTFYRRSKEIDSLLSQFHIMTWKNKEIMSLVAKKISLHKESPRYLW